MNALPNVPTGEALNTTATEPGDAQPPQDQLQSVEPAGEALCDQMAVQPIHEDDQTAAKQETMYLSFEEPPAMTSQTKVSKALGEPAVEAFLSDAQESLAEKLHEEVPPAAEEPQPITEEALPDTSSALIDE